MVTSHLTECGSVVNNTLQSNGYPNHYPGNMDCDFTVQIPENKTININFIYFNLEDSVVCRYVSIMASWMFI